MDARTEIDWGKLAHFGPNEIECQCGTVYMSLSKSVIEAGKYVTYTRRPCPSCGADRNHAVRISSSPELMVISRRDSERD